jgi:thermitase
VPTGPGAPHRVLRARLRGALALLVGSLVLGHLPPSSRAEASLAAGRVIVAARSGAASIPEEVAGALYGATSVVELPRLGARLWLVPVGTEPDVAARLAARPDVEYAEPDRLLRLHATATDVLYPTHQWNLPKIGAPSAWDVTTGRADVSVAVIDSGFDTLHPDGPAHLRLGCDYVRWRVAAYAGSCPTVADDENGHGTHVVGIVAARQSNVVGISGLAPGVTLVAIRTADAAGSSYMSDVAQAIREAADSGVRVVNLSLGGTTPTTTLQRAVEHALARGVVVVASAGNGFADGSPAEYPAAFPGVLAVAASTADDQRAGYSTVGDYVDLAAPVGNGDGATPESAITSLYPTTKGSYAMMVGTSQAAPQAAALAALLLSARPALGGDEVAEILRRTARPLGGAAPNPMFGYGQIDAGSAVARAATGVAPTPSPEPTATPRPSPTASPTPGGGSATGATWRYALPLAVRARGP